MSTSGRGRSASHGKTVSSPRSPQSMTDASSSSRWTAIGPGRGVGPAQRRQQQRRQLRVAQRVRADGETVVVVEQAERALLPGAQEVRLVTDAAQPRHHVRLAGTDPDDHVEQPGPARRGTVSARSDLDLAARPTAPQVEPGLGEGPQRVVPVSGRHASVALSSGARSNHKNP